MVEVRWNPHPVTVTIKDNGDFMRVLRSSYHYYRVGVHLGHNLKSLKGVIYGIK